MAETELGFDENIEAALCYLFLWVTGILFYLLEEDNKFVRFHAIQSILTFLPLTFIAWILAGFFGFRLWGPRGYIPWIIGYVLWVLVAILWLVLMFKAYKGKKYKLPFVGDIAEERA
jgi:uncharacterized membrane protein